MQLMIRPTAYTPELWNKVAPVLAQHPTIIAAVAYGNIAGETSSSTETLAEVNIPAIHHLAGKATGQPKKTEKLKEYIYPDVSSHKFATPFQEEFHYNTENVSHTRNLTFLKQHQGGPYFDLEMIWEEHTWYEFADRSMEHTMSTMVQEPYVNHVPTVSLKFMHLHFDTKRIWQG